VDLRPGLDEPPLSCGKAAAEAFDRVHGKDCGVVSRRVRLTVARHGTRATPSANANASWSNRCLGG
jgi:hypothetical protein